MVRLGVFNVPRQPMKKLLPKEITSYDLFKTLAIVLMLADHIGYYLYPEENWWRVFGRMCVPIWFFLVGYAQSRDFGAKMWIGALILVGANFIVGMSIVPLNILATMLVIRLVIDRVMEVALRKESLFWQTIVALFLLIIPTMFGVEYGSQGLLLAMFGYVMRHNEDPRITDDLRKRFFLASYLIFVLPQAFLFGFDQPQSLVMYAGVFAVMGTLYFFRPLVFPRLTEALPRPLTALLQFTGRYTLEIYVAHLLVLKFAGALLEPERFVWFDWKWFSPTGV